MTLGEIERLSAPPIWKDPFLVEYERAYLELMMKMANPPILIGTQPDGVFYTEQNLTMGALKRAVNILKEGDTVGEGTKSATQKLDEVKSTVANLEGQVAKLQEEKTQLAAKVLAQQAFVNDRALYVNLDGSLKNTGVYLESMSGGYRIAYTVYFTEFPRVEPRQAGRADYARQDMTRRGYRLQFSQGKLHVYQEV